MQRPVVYLVWLFVSYSCSVKIKGLHSQLLSNKYPFILRICFPNSINSLLISYFTSYFPSLTPFSNLPPPQFLTTFFIYLLLHSLLLSSPISPHPFFIPYYFHLPPHPSITPFSNLPPPQFLTTFLIYLLHPLLPQVPVFL